MTRHVLSFVALLALACGADTYDSQGSNLARGTDAEISVSDDDSGNHRLHVEIRHLPPPARLEPGHQFFVVWSIPEGSTPQHVGTLNYDEDDRFGELETLTPYKDFEVLVTVEKERLPATPSEHVVIRREVSHD